jgi:hypothetical protein
MPDSYCYEPGNDRFAQLDRYETIKKTFEILLERIICHWQNLQA